MTGIDKTIGQTREIADLKRQLADATNKVFEICETVSLMTKDHYAQTRQIADFYKVMADQAAEITKARADRVAIAESIKSLIMVYLAEDAWRQDPETVLYDMPENISKLIDQAVTMSADDFKGLQVGASVDVLRQSPWSGIILTAFKTRTGAPGLVIECTDGDVVRTAYIGMIDIASPDQVKPKGAMI